MIRASLYLLATGVIWMAEGFIFSRFLGYQTWQTVLMAAIYLALFFIVVRAFIRFLQRQEETDGAIAQWRLLAAAPMLVVVAGSFASLPILLLILALGKIA